MLSMNETEEFWELFHNLSAISCVSFADTVSGGGEQMNQQTKLYFQKTAVLLAVYLVFRFLLPIVLPFFLAWITVGFLTVIQKKFHIKLMPLSIGFLLIFLLLSGSAIFCGCYLLYEPCRSLLPVCQNYFSRFSEYISWLPESLSGQLMDTMPSVFACMFGIFLYMVSVLLFAKDWKRFYELLTRLPFSKPVLNAGKRITQSIRGWIKAQFKIMVVIFIECGIGYYFLHIPGFLLWAALTGIVDALPVFGTGTIFFPWIFIVLLQGRYQLAVWLGLLYVLTWLTRELLEPKLLGDGLGLLPICFLMSVIAGLKLFGTLGLFTGPFGVLFIRELWAELETSAPPENP